MLHSQSAFGALFLCLIFPSPVLAPGVGVFSFCISGFCSAEEGGGKGGSLVVDIIIFTQICSLCRLLFLSLFLYLYLLILSYLSLSFSLSPSLSLSFVYMRTLARKVYIYFSVEKGEDFSLPKRRLT